MHILCSCLFDSLITKTCHFLPTSYDGMSVVVHMNKEPFSQIWWPDGKDKWWISLSEVDQDLTNKWIRFRTVDTSVSVSRNHTYLLIHHHFPRPHQYLAQDHKTRDILTLWTFPRQDMAQMYNTDSIHSLESLQVVPPSCHDANSVLNGHSWYYITVGPSMSLHLCPQLVSSTSIYRNTHNGSNTHSLYDR